MPWSRMFGGVLLSLLAILCGCASGREVLRSTEGFPAGTGFQVRSLQVDNQPHRYAVFLPRDYSRSKKYPTIVFLHGLFESGDDGIKCLSAGLGPIIAKEPAKWPFVVIFPQTFGDWQSPEKDRLVMACLNQVVHDYSVDEDRVILAGLSLGGGGTWSIGARHPDRFAALVPVSGSSALDAVVGLIRLPIWAFHNTGDPIVSVGTSEEMCQRIRSLGGNVKLTEFHHVGHDCWDQAVAQSSLVDWMLQQRRSPQAARAMVAGVQ